jgi:bifunctional non-homologous end joining protein LigD
MLAEIAPKAFNSDKHIWEIKFDGVRMLADCDLQEYHLQSRSGRNKTKLYPELQLETRLPAVLDGEMVCYKDGVPVFKGIQHRANRENNIDFNSKLFPATYEVFDIISADGEDLQRLPLIERKTILSQILVPTDNVRLAQWTEDGEALFAEARKNADHFNATGELLGPKEGVVGKLKTGTYQQDKRNWLKVKCLVRQEFVVCGYTEGTGWRQSSFGALVLGEQNGNGLKYVGSVGTGFDDAEIRKLCQRMTAVGTADCPFGRPPEPATWIQPALVVVIEYMEKTNDGKLRFPSYKGLVN